MKVTAIATLILSLFLAWQIIPATLLSRVAKASMSTTFFMNLLLLSASLGYLNAERHVQDVAMGISVVGLLLVGTLLETKNKLPLVISKAMCFTMAAMLVFNGLLAHGVVSLA